MTGRWKARKSKTPLSLPSHRPLEISPNTVRFPHSHPTANEKIGTLLTDSKKPQLERKVSTICPVCCVNYVPGCTVSGRPYRALAIRGPAVSLLLTQASKVLIAAA